MPRVPSSSPELFSMLRLGSAALPVGAFAYSQGLECAIAEGLIRTGKETEAWIRGVLQHSVSTCDVPLLRAMREAFELRDDDELAQLDTQWRATRGTRELRDEDRQLGCSLMRLLANRQDDGLTGYHLLKSPSFGYAFAYAGLLWSIHAYNLAHAYCFSWLEAQLGAATRLVPLGQNEAQAILGTLLVTASIDVERGLEMDPADVSTTVPGQALCSARHEFLYSRLFRS